MKKIFSKQIFISTVIFLLLTLFFFNSINTLTYVFDGGHHGSIFLNGLDIINNKIPYKEIFLQYGFLNALINSIFLRILNQDILAIYVSTSLFYFTAILFIGLIAKEFNNYKALIFAITISLFNHPIPEYPWPNYSAFFFLVLSAYFFNIENDIKLFFSGFFIALSFLSRENFYYFIIPTFIFINFLVYYFYKDKIKIFFLISGLCFPLIIFLIYLLKNDIFLDWLEFQKIPYAYLEAYDVNFFQLLWRFITFFITEVPFRLGVNPQYLIILIILIFNIYIFVEEIFFKKIKNIKIIYINTLCISSLIVSINLELFRLYTSILIGLPVIFYKLKSLRDREFKFFILFSLLFISFFSIYYFPKGNVKFFKNISYDKSLSNNEIKYFKNQKWEEDKWDLIKNIKFIDDQIVEKCRINYVLNLTPNAFILPLSKLDRIQTTPVFNEHLGRDFSIKFQKNFKQIASEKIFKEDIYIYSMENNISVLENNLSNYKILYKINVKGYKGSEIRVFVPIKCFMNLQN